jgi:hypothetical protein
VSDRRKNAKKALDLWASKIGAWGPRHWDAAFQAVLVNIASDTAVEEIVAQFGGKIPLMPWFVANARGDVVEEAIGRMMSTTAQLMTDGHCQPMPMVEIVKKHEEIDDALSKAAKLIPHVVEEDVGKLAAYIYMLERGKRELLPINDPLVKRRPPVLKDCDDRAAAEYAHAYAMRARLQPEARRIFGKAGDEVAKVFVEAATGIVFSKGHRLTRFGHRKRKPRGDSTGGGPPAPTP